MQIRTARWSAVACVAALFAVHPARAQWAVVDAPAIVQLIKQVEAMAQQLEAARDEVAQTKQAYQSMTGQRGMENLLSGTLRNYLPADWSELEGVMQGGAVGYTGLAANVRNAIATNSVLSAERLATLSASDQRQILATRQTSALQQALTQAALANTSGRFGALQSLVASIASAQDQKAVLELQARIGVELGMLQNEQIKLQALHQAVQAQEAARAAQLREESLAGQGRFQTRFQPVP